MSVSLTALHHAACAPSPQEIEPYASRRGADPLDGGFIVQSAVSEHSLCEVFQIFQHDRKIRKQSNMKSSMKLEEIV